MAEQVPANAEPVCFVAGTLVRMADADGPEVLRPIEQVAVGEQMWVPKDTDPHGPVSLCTVAEVFRHGPRHVINAHVANGEVLRVSPLHPFWVVDRGWTPAGQLKLGDPLLSPTGKRVGVTEVFDNGEIEPVFNLHVANAHTYFVGTPDGKHAVLVHNQSNGGTGLLEPPTAGAAGQIAKAVGKAEAKAAPSGLRVSPAALGTVAGIFAGIFNPATNQDLKVPFSQLTNQQKLDFFAGVIGSKLGNSGLSEKEIEAYSKIILNAINDHLDKVAKGTAKLQLPQSPDEAIKAADRLLANAKAQIQAEAAAQAAGGAAKVPPTPPVATGGDSGPGGTGKWNKGSFNSPAESLAYHFGKHGANVGTEMPPNIYEKLRRLRKT